VKKILTFEDVLNERLDSLLEHLVLRLFHGHHVVELVRPDIVDGDHVGVGPGGDVDVVVGQQAVTRRRPHLRSETRDLST
jgi:hypothetical protein